MNDANTQLPEGGPLDGNVRRRTPTRRVLVDHRTCGGGGCSRCNERGTKMVVVLRVGAPMPRDAEAFEAARERCPCYEGYSINAGVSQCTHADRRDDGEWCELGVCPLVPPNV